MSAVGPILVATVSIVAGWLLGGWGAGLVNASLGRTRMDPLVRSLAVHTVRPAVMAVAVIVAFHALHIDTGGLIALLAGAAAAVALGLKNTLRNVAAGALLLSLRPFNLGDTVEVASVRGTVRELGLWATVIETEDGQLVMLLNDGVLHGPVRNLTRKGAWRVEATVPVPRDLDFDAAANSLLRAVAADERFAKTPAPQVLASAVASDHLDARVRAWTAPTATFADPESAESALRLLLDRALRET